MTDIKEGIQETDKLDVVANVLASNEGCVAKDKTKIQVKVREGFNKLWIYPANEEAQELARMRRRETFTKADLKFLEESGYTIEILPTFSLEDLYKAKNLK